jgi:hypothetical protein
MINVADWARAISTGAASPAREVPAQKASSTGSIRIKRARTVDLRLINVCLSLAREA